MVLEFLFASTLATGITFKEEISRASANNLPASESTELTDIQKKLFKRAIKAFEGKKYEEAIPLLIRAIKLNPYYPPYYSGLGNCYANLGQYDNALECYDKALDLDGKMYDMTDEARKAVWELSEACEEQLKSTTAKVEAPIKKKKARSK